MTLRPLPVVSAPAPPSPPVPGTQTMVHEIVTSLAPAAVLERAVQFFAERVPHSAAYPEQQGPSYLVLRGQGGEEIAFSATAGEAGTRVRASTLFFDQAISRFFTTLPVAADSTGAAPGEQEAFA